MKVYEFGEKEKPSIMLFPGTCCHWEGCARGFTATFLYPGR